MAERSCGFWKWQHCSSAGLLACIASLKSTGWIDLDWMTVEIQISHAIAIVHQGAEGLKHILSEYLPSMGV